MWKKILSILGFIVVLVAASIGGQIGKEVGKSAFAPSKPTQQQIEEKLLEGFTKAAEQANSRGPVMVDQDTRWDKSVAGPGARLTYFYSFPKYSSRDIERGWLLANLQPEVRKSVCGSKEMKPSLQYGGIYVYSYTGNDGVEIARFELSKHDCDSPPLHASTASAPTYDSKGWTQESTRSTEIGPWLDYSPSGTRYYRDANRVIYRVFPPGVRPDAEAANPFGLGDSSEHVPQ